MKDNSPPRAAPGKIFAVAPMMEEKGNSNKSMR
jgi:hypothetical protein